MTTMKLKKLQEKLKNLEREADITRDEMAKLESKGILEDLKDTDILSKFKWEFRSDGSCALNLISERDDKLERELDNLVGRNNHHESVDLTDHIYLRFDDHETQIIFNDYIKDSIKTVSEEIFYQFIKDFNIKIGFKSLDENITYTEKKLKELQEKKKKLVEKLKSVL